MTGFVTQPWTRLTEIRAKLTAERIAFVRGAAAATGLLALVTPFTADISPAEGMLLALGVEGDALFLFAVSAPALVALPIAVWQVRRAFFGAATKIEVALAYLFSVMAMLPVLVVSSLAFSGGEQSGSLSGVSALTIYWVTVTANVGLFVRNRLKQVPPETCAETFLLLAYIPNALYALTVFSYWGLVFGPSWMWDVGAYIALTTCVVYVFLASALLRLGRSKSARQVPPN